MTLSSKFEKCIHVTNLQLNSYTLRNSGAYTLREKYMDAPAAFFFWGCEGNNFLKVQVYVNKTMDSYIVVVYLYDRTFIHYLNGINSMPKAKSRFQNVKYSMISLM